MTTGGEPFAASIEKEANTSSDPNITFVAEPNTHSTEEPLNVTSELNPNDRVLHFIVQNFDRVNAIYTAFNHTRKEVSHRSLPTGGNPSRESWNSDSKEAHPSKALGKTFVENEDVEPILANNTKGKGTQNMEFYHQPFVFKEPNRDTKDLVASPFTNRIREYDMPDGLKVPTNLKAYDVMSDPNDHLTVFMGTMDIHKLLVPKLQTAEDLQGDALLHYDAEMELMNMILLSIPNDIYNSVDACTLAKDMWKRVERLMRGTIQ
ncbi:hypothetical protein Tco_1205058, partial [Tanacetum coccineum]